MYDLENAIPQKNTKYLFFSYYTGQIKANQ